MEKVNDLADNILKNNLEKLKDNEAIFRSKYNPESIHEMRLASRRLRAAIKTFHRFLPSTSKNIHTKLKQFSAVLGKKRDLDIFSKCILLTLKKHLISEPLDIPNVIQNLIESLEKLKTKATKVHTLKFSRKHIRKALKEVIEIAPYIDLKTDDKTLHKLRISIKKLKYICEFFEPIFSKEICPLDLFIEKTRKLQTILGEHQDAIMGISKLVTFKKQFTSQEFSLIKRKYELKKRKTRISFFKIWSKFLADIEFLYSVSK